MIKKPGVVLALLGMSLTAFASYAQADQAECATTTFTSGLSKTRLIRKESFHDGQEFVSFSECGNPSDSSCSPVGSQKEYPLSLVESQESSRLWASGVSTAVDVLPILVGGVAGLIRGGIMDAATYGGNELAFWGLTGAGLGAGVGLDVLGAKYYTPANPVEQYHRAMAVQSADRLRIVLSEAGRKGEIHAVTDAGVWDRGLSVAKGVFDLGMSNYDSFGNDVQNFSRQSSTAQ
jgi:hypothetical protein